MILSKQACYRINSLINHVQYIDKDTEVSLSLQQFVQNALNIANFVKYEQRDVQIILPSNLYSELSYIITNYGDDFQ